MNAEDAILFPSRGDEVCADCRIPIDGFYTHVTEQGLDVIVCPQCGVADFLRRAVR